MASSSQLFLSSESHTTEQRLVWLTYFIFCELRVWNGRRPAGGTSHSVTSCGVNKRGRVLKYGLVQANRDIVQNEPVYCVFWHLVQKSLKTEIFFKTHSKQTNSGFCVLVPPVSYFSLLEVLKPPWIKSVYDFFTWFPGKKDFYSVSQNKNNNNKKSPDNKIFFF